jgi:hypothetical protein
MQEMVSRHEVFMKRFELSDHPNDKEYLRSMNAQMLNAGGSIRMMFEGWVLAPAARPALIPARSCG